MGNLLDMAMFKNYMLNYQRVDPSWAVAAKPWLMISSGTFGDKTLPVRHLGDYRMSIGTSLQTNQYNGMIKGFWWILNNAQLVLALTMVIAMRNTNCTPRIVDGKTSPVKPKSSNFWSVFFQGWCESPCLMSGFPCSKFGKHGLLRPWESSSWWFN